VLQYHKFTIVLWTIFIVILYILTDFKHTIKNERLESLASIPLWICSFAESASSSWPSGQASAGHVRPWSSRSLRPPTLYLLAILARTRPDVCGYFTSISAVLTPAFFSSSVLIAFRYVRQPSAHSSRVALPRVPNDLHLLPCCILVAPRIVVTIFAWFIYVRHKFFIICNYQHE
jgi:hypothetical protein